MVVILQKNRKHKKSLEKISFLFVFGEKYSFLVFSLISGFLTHFWFSDKVVYYL